MLGSSRGTPELPCLEDVLAKYAERAFLDIELKTEGLEEVTLELLARFPAKRGVGRFLISAGGSAKRSPPLDAGSPKRTPDALSGSELPLGLIFATRRRCGNGIGFRSPT